MPARDGGLSITLHRAQARSYEALAMRMALTLVATNSNSLHVRGYRLLTKPVKLASLRAFLSALHDAKKR
ncbi:hypothetical protein [Xanthomonas sp. WCS2019Cala2-53]|uniref:hypothetical protein n=1 Tax=Xanthomonas sp. WCS2019Cala2-53 TaxID=3073651 RepID=UPI002FCB3FEB